MQASKGSEPPQAISFEEVEPTTQLGTTVEPAKDSRGSGLGPSSSKALLDNSVWSTPIAFRSSGSSNTHFYASDLFVEEDGYIPGRGRKRTLFGRRSGEWRSSYEVPKVAPEMDLDSDTGSQHGSSSHAVSTSSSVTERSQSPRDLIAVESGSQAPVETTTAPETPEPDPTAASSSLVDIHQSMWDGQLEQPRLQLDAGTPEPVSSPLLGFALPQTPLSPRLHPVDSFSLPLVSPLQAEETGPDPQHPSMGLKKGAVVGSREVTKDADESPCGSSNADSVVNLRELPVGANEQTRTQLLQPFVDAQTYDSRFLTEGDLSNFEESSLLISSSTARDLPATLGESTHTVLEGNVYRSNSQMLEHVEGNQAEERAVSPSGEPDFASVCFQEGQLIDVAVREQDGGSRGMASQMSDADQDKDVLLLTHTDEQVPEADIDQAFQKGTFQELLGTPQQFSIAEPTPPSTQLDGTVDEDMEQPLRHRVNQLLDQPPTLTPAATSSNLEDILVQQEHENAKTLAPHESPRRESSTAEPPILQVPERSNLQKLTPNSKAQRRKSDRHRVGDVPDVISPWFGSRKARKPRHGLDLASVQLTTARVTRASAKALNESATSPTLTTAVSPTGPSPTRPRSLRSNAINKATQDVISMSPTSVFQTPKGLYQPLHLLENHLGPGDSQGPETIDLCCVVMKESSKPKRSKKGPRDHYAILHVSDTSIHPRKIEVQFFRPFAKSLPEAEVGDVILLRNFAVKSRERQCFLLSSGPSAWLVWRFSKHSQDGSRAVTAGQGTSTASPPASDAIQECNGPPVELGDEENQRAAELRKWWLDVASKTPPSPAK